MEHFLEGSAPFKLCKLIQKKRIVFVTLLIWVNVSEQFLQGIFRNFSIKAPELENNLQIRRPDEI